MDKSSLFGMFRAKVIDNKDLMKMGRCFVWIPDIMPEVDDTKGLWARPANNPVGGRNLEGDSEHHFMGSSYIPKIGSWTFVFFECGNINRPYYFGALDLENTKVLPENQLGDNYEDKWTILKSHRGRCIIISDDPDDERVEITGKKKDMAIPPTGDTDSVYRIDGNQTVVLLDERDGKEKLLIRTREGDFFHIDVNEQKLQCNFKKGIVLETGGSLHVKVADDINIECGKNMHHESGQSMNRKAGMDMNDEAGTNLSRKAGGTIAEDGSSTFIQSGSSISATIVHPDLPDGLRDT